MLGFKVYIVGGDSELDSCRSVEFLDLTDGVEQAGRWNHVRLRGTVGLNDRTFPLFCPINDNQIVVIGGSFLADVILYNGEHYAEFVLEDHESSLDLKCRCPPILAEPGIIISMIYDSNYKLHLI